MNFFQISAVLIVMTYVIVVFSILVQGVTLERVARRVIRS